MIASTELLPIRTLSYLVFTLCSQGRIMLATQNAFLSLHLRIEAATEWITT